MALIEFYFFFLICVTSVSTKTDIDYDYDTYNEGFNTDACNLTIRPFTTPDKRLVSNVLGENETFISDNNILFDWFGQPNYKLFAGKDPGTNSCGTINPVYLEDDSKARQSTKNITQLWACVHDEGNGCSFRVPISMTFCEQLNHYIYRLSPEVPPNAGFCLEQFNSQLNYITNVEVIIPPPVEVAGQLKYQFKCMFDLSTSDDFWYHVTWYRDGQLIKSFPPISHSDDPVGGSVLDETLFGGGLGFKIQCGYAVSLQADSETGYVYKSPEKFVGIEIITPTIYIADGSRSEIKVRPTIPIGCPSSNPECSLTVNIIEPASSTSSCSPESSFSDCGISISSANWNQEYSVKLSADPATQYGSKSAVNTITLKTSSSFPQSIWQDYTIGTVTIRTSQDTAAIQGKSCYAVCDPHMRTFAGKNYEHQYEGLYTLYENTEWKQEIQMKTAPCIDSRDGKPYCPCGVAVRVGREVFVIERCAPSEYWKIEYLQCSETGVKLIDIKRSGNYYEFKLPSGLILKTSVYQQRKFINLDVYPTEADTTATGLCGQIGSDVFYKRDRNTVPYVNYPGMPDFSSSWSVPDSHIDLFSDEVKSLDSVGTGGIFCKCTTPVGSTEPQFTCEQSDDTCAITIGSSESVDQCKVGSLTSKRSVDRHRARRHAHKLKNDRKKRQVTELTWRNGWNETTATDYCNNLFDNSAIVQKCKEIPNVDLSFPRENCVLDIKFMGDTSFALVALETIVNQCIREVTYDSKYHSPTNSGTSLLEEIKVVACPLDCSYHGTCNKGVCTCESGWAGNDCSMDTSIVPVIDHIANEGYCDLNAGSCDDISVYGGDFIDGSSTICKLSSSQMMENGEFGPKSEIEEPSILKSIGEVQCGLGKSRKKRSTTTQPDDEFVKVYSVSVSNNGIVYSNRSLVVIFNSKCQFCTITATNDVQCNYTGDFCISDGTCYGNGEPHSQHTCYTCSVENGARKWLKSSGGDCDDDDLLWIIGVVLGVVLIFVIIVVLVYCVMKKKKTQVGSSNMKTSPPPYSNGSP